MDIFGIILGILIGINLIIVIATHNWLAVCGWLVAGLEWARRLTN